MGRNIVLCFIALFFGLSGCGHRVEKSELFNATLLGEIECVAVAPFENKSATAAAARIVEEIVQTELTASQRFRVMEAVEFRRSLKEGAQLPEWIGTAQRLKVHGLLTGKVLEYGYKEDPSSGEGEPAVSVQLQLYHLPTGNRVWSGQIDRSSRELNTRNRDPLSRVTMLAVSEIIAELSSSASKRTTTAGMSMLCGN